MTTSRPIGEVIDVADKFGTLIDVTYRTSEVIENQYRVSEKKSEANLSNKPSEQPLKKPKNTHNQQEYNWMALN